MVSIESGSKHRLKGTNLKWGKCRLGTGNVQNGVAAYKFLVDRNAHIGRKSRNGKFKRLREEAWKRVIADQRWMAFHPTPATPLSGHILLPPTD